MTMIVAKIVTMTVMMIVANSLSASICRGKICLIKNK